MWRFKYQLPYIGIFALSHTNTNVWKENLEYKSQQLNEKSRILYLKKQGHVFPLLIAHHFLRLHITIKLQNDLVSMIFQSTFFFHD